MTLAKSNFLPCTSALDLDRRSGPQVPNLGSYDWLACATDPRGHAGSRACV